MGTHPIFESDFDCLTEKEKMTDRRRVEQRGNGILLAPPMDLRDKIQTMADASSKYGANDDMSTPGGGQLIDQSKMTDSMLYPVGLNLLEKGTRELVSKLTDERTKQFKKDILLEKGIKKGRRVVASGGTATLVPNTRKMANNERTRTLFIEGINKDYALDEQNRIIGKVDNIDANRHEAVRAKLIKDIVKREKKRKETEKRARIERIKDQGKSTCVLLKGLREKTFNKTYLKKKLAKFGEIIRVSSVEGQARAVMIRFDEPTSCKRAFTALKANFGTIFPRFPNGEVKLVKPERKKNQFERAEPIISAFAAVEKME